MFKQKLFQQLSEQIHSYAYGDSVHVRYIVLYTSFDNLIVIAEDKYKLTVSIETLKWKKDSIISMKYYSCALHILTITGEYIEIVLANIFQANKQKDDSLMQTILLHDALLPNNMKLKDVYLIKSFSDFVIMTKSKNKIAFISQSGQILFYNSEIKTITQIIALRQTLQYSQTIEIDQKEQIIGITEFNDLITFSDTDQEPQIHRFADPNYSIVQIYFVGNENILILQENKKEQRFVKYKLKKLKYVKKYYYLPKDDCEYKFVEIHELPKIFLALVFKQTQYEIISLSKKVLQERLQKNVPFKFQNIYEENKQILDFQKIFYCPDTTLLNTKEIHNQVIHFSKYNQQFRTKLTKKQLNEVLKSDQSIINKEDRKSELKNIEFYCSLLITSTQIYIIQLCQEYKDELTFTKLQQLENYERTFNHIPKLTLCWQEKVIQFLWHHLNCEQGIKHYFKDKDNISEQIYKWVNSLTHNENIYQKLENLQNTQIIYIENQYDKCLATIALLNFKNLSNEISISRIVSMVFNKSLDYCNQIVTDNSNTFLQLIQFIKSNSNPVLCYNYWKNSQQLLFILINILEVWLTYCMHKYDLTLIKAQEFFEPQFFNKIRSLIVSCKVPISLRLKLILFLQDYQYVKLFTLGIQQIENKQELINFSQICNITNDFPSFNIYSIQHLLDECDILYIKNLIQISGNQGIQNEIDQSKPKNPSFGLIIQSILTGQSNNIEICKIINWFLS